ncbi:MAG: hypothetical protein KatS3mg028_0430 [Bacteroidia bacterium]|nr:MAG: hypothetical protein KatS3mg028_0430 [Bacteroidia bacterium]
MKPIIVSMLIACTAVLNAQKQAPDAVKKSFAAKFPDVKKVKWEKENGNWEANFDKDKKEYSAVFSEDGKWVETEVEIPANELPAAVKDAVNKRYPNTPITEAAIIEKNDGFKVYEAEIKYNGKKVDLLLDEKGKFLN